MLGDDITQENREPDWVGSCNNSTMNKVESHWKISAEKTTDILKASLWLCCLAYIGNKCGSKENSYLLISKCRNILWLYQNSDQKGISGVGEKWSNPGHACRDHH